MSELSFIDICAADDATKEQVRAWRNSNAVREYMLSQDIISDEEHARWIGSLEGSLTNKFWVVSRNNLPIGAVYLQNIDHTEKQSEWGFYIGEDDCRGKGLAKLILYFLLEKVFCEMDIDKLLTKVFSGNDRAIGVYKKFCFEQKGRFLTEDNRVFIVFEFARSKWDQIKGELKKSVGR